MKTSANLIGFPDCYTYHYQPQVKLSDGRLRGFECLVRLNHPTRGIVSPAEFLPTLFATKSWQYLWPVLLNQISDKMKSYPEMCVAVNVSPSELLNTSTAFMKHYFLMVLDNRLDPSRIEVEITEDFRICPTQYKSINSSIGMLNVVGTKVIVDDFGSGFTSFDVLDSLDVDGVKIDRSIISDLEGSKTNRNIVKSLVNIGIEKNFFIVAEGIETKSQWNISLDLGCQYGQGFYIGRPSPCPTDFYDLKGPTRRDSLTISTPYAKGAFANGTSWL